jgi:hypothetical protein
VSRVSFTELNFAKNSKAVKVIDLHQCRCQNVYKTAFQYALVLRLVMHVFIAGMNILLGRTSVNKFVEYYGEVSSAKHRMSFS